MQIGMTYAPVPVVVNLHYFYEYAATDRFRGQAFGLNFAAKLDGVRLRSSRIGERGLPRMAEPVYRAINDDFADQPTRQGGSMAMHRSVMGLLVAACVGVASTGAIAAKPDATLKLSGKSVAAGVGYSWGSGTLTYKGKRHSFSVDGLSVGDVGASSITATGSVYHLKKLEDFDGQYTAVSTGASVGGGGGVGSMRNANGVVINLKATTRGVKLKAGVDGIKMKLE